MEDGVNSTRDEGPDAPASDDAGLHGDPADASTGPATRLEAGPTTRLEAPSESATPRDPRTRVESDRPDHGPTTRLEGTQPDSDDGPDRNIRIPRSLVAENYRVDRVLSRSGAQADVTLVFSPNGEPQVLKHYRDSSRRLDDNVREGLSRAAYAHVVQQYRDGEEDGRYWELLEYIEGGSLGEMRASLPAHRVSEDLALEIVRELSSALEHIHEKNWVHRDIKPGNILVRSQQPLDLVLADFGITVTISRTREIHSEVRTIEYAPPESNGGQTSAAWDWWSLGMVVLEALTGEHPFRPGGQSWYPARIVAFLSTKDIPLDGIDDARWMRFFQGLFVRDPQHRWGADEVRRWLDGEEPDVYEGETAAGPFIFNGESLETPRRLAVAFASNWRDAARLIGQPSSATEVAEWLEAAGAAPEAVRVCTGPLEYPSLDYRLIRLIVAMEPQIAPVFMGVAVTRLGLSGLCAAAVQAGGTGSSMQTIDELRDTHVLTLFARQKDGFSPRRTDEEWHECLGEIDRLVEDHVPDRAAMITPTIRSILEARILMALADPEVARDLRDRADRIALSRQSSEWFNRLAASPARSFRRIPRDALIITLEPRVADRPESAAHPTIELFEVTPFEDIGGERMTFRIYGSPVTVAWRVSNASSIAISGLGDSLRPEGTAVLPMRQSGQIVLTARNQHGSARAVSQAIDVLPVTALQMPAIPVPAAKVQLSLGRNFYDALEIGGPFVEPPPLAIFGRTESERINAPSLDLPDLPTIDIELPPLPIILHRAPNQESQ